MTAFGLRGRLLAIVVLLLTPVWVVTLSRFGQERTLMASAAEDEAQRLARATARLEEEVVAGIHQALVSLAHSVELQALPPRCGRMEALARSFPFYAELTVFGAGGSMLCRDRQESGARPEHDRATIEEAIRLRGLAVGPYRSVGAGGEGGAVGFAYPVVAAAGQVPGAVYALVRVAAFQTPVEELALRESSSLLLVDRDGMVLMRRPQPMAWVGRSSTGDPIRTILLRGEGVIESTDLDGQARVFAFRPLGGTGSRLFLAAGISKQEALAIQEQRDRLHVMALALISLLGLVAAWVMGGRPVTPHLESVAAVARRLRAGDLTARVSVSGDGEVAALAEAFNDMAAGLSEIIHTEREARALLAQQINTLVGDRTREVTLLNQMGELLQACFSLDQAYTVLGGAVHQFFPHRAGAVCVFNETRELVEEVASWGHSLEGPSRFPPDECWALRGGRPHVVDELGTPFCQHVAKPLPTGSICIPLLAQGEAFGIFYLCNPAGSHVQGFSEETRRLAAAVAKQIALALANLRLRETLRGQSIRDALTGLYNRRYMEETVERELRRATRSGRPLGVIMADVDSFKLLNDTFGHGGGDAVLRAVGVLLKNMVRGSDIACRYGGDEFVLILPETGLEPTAAKAEQLREAVKRLQIPHRGQIIEGISVSLGVAAFPEVGPDAASLLAAADEAQYAAKAAGKDQVRRAPVSVRAPSAAAAPPKAPELAQGTETR